MQAVELSKSIKTQTRLSWMLLHCSQKQDSVCVIDQILKAYVQDVCHLRSYFFFFFKKWKQAHKIYRPTIVLYVEKFLNHIQILSMKWGMIFSIKSAVSRKMILNSKIIFFFYS